MLPARFHLKVPSTRYPCAAVPRLGKEPGEYLALLLLLAQHQVASRFKADESSAGDPLGRTPTRLVRCKLVVSGVGDQGGYADRLEVVVVRRTFGASATAADHT